MNSEILPAMDPGNLDARYQERILPDVSRTFALTIPELPASLRIAVTNAYLLCRIADTIEDEPNLSAAETLAFMRRFTAVVAGREEVGNLAGEIADRLTEHTLPTERALMLDMQRVINVTALLTAQERSAIHRCLELMCYGMPKFQASASLCGLPRLQDLDEYCYYVAGVVGDMLTELFCEYSAAIAVEREGLQSLAVSFAQGLQMTNILKDVWEDRSRGVCWLPQDVFASHGIELSRLSPASAESQFAAAMREMIGIAHAHLRNALRYTLLIPRNEAGIRRFCLWAIGLAVLTLQKINRNPGFVAGAQVKVSRKAVAITRMVTERTLRHGWLLRGVFATAARGLPLSNIAETFRPKMNSQPDPLAAVRRSYGSSIT